MHEATLLPGLHRLCEAGQDHAAGESFGEERDGAAGFVHTPRGSQRPYAQHLPLLRQSARREPASMLTDELQSGEEVATGVRRLSTLKERELGCIRLLRIEWPYRPVTFRDRDCSQRRV
jgi:hypothetical protein